MSETYNNSKLDIHEMDDDKSLHSNDSRLNEYEKWRIAINAKQFKAYIKINSLKGKIYKERLQLFIDKINGKKIHWINVSRETNLNVNEKGLFITLTFPDEENLKAALELEFETNNEKKKVKIAQAIIQKRKYTTPQNAIVKLWNIPFMVNHNDFIHILEAKFKRIKLHRIYLSN